MKKNKAEKLKRVHIWPTIFLILFFFILMNSAIALSVTALLENVIESKMVQGYKETGLIYDLLRSAEGDYASKDAELANMERILTDVSAVCIIEDGRFIYQNTDDQPNMKTVITYKSFSDMPILMDVSELDLNELHPIGISADGGISVDVSALVRVMSKISDRTDGENDRLTGYGVVAKQAVWFTYKMNEEQSLFVKYHINIYFSDIVINMAIMFGMALLVVFVCFFLFVNAVRSILNQRRVTRMYYMDLETGANNFKYFLTTATRLLKHNFIRRRSYAIVHFQLQKYRNYASCYGDKEVNLLLCDFDKIIKKNKKYKEVYARAEKADFGFLMSYTSREELQTRVENLMYSLQQVRNGQRFVFLAGIYLVDKGKRTVENMYHMAATARASLTDDNKMGIAFFTEEMLEKIVWERKVLNDMDEALRDHDFKVYLQPKYSTENEQLAAAEALVRWIHKTEGFVPPNRFIPIMEANGSIMMLDDYMISEVARLQAEWIAQGKPIVPISVNVSRTHFMREDLAEHICQLVDVYRVPHEYIELELTESAFFDDKKALIRIAKRMKELGFAISMDDFGAGYSSLNSLKELPVDVVKLDAEFFRGNDEAGKGRVIVSEAISLAKKLDMKIVAEGIETKEQVDFLAKENCDLIQGFYFAKPMPVDEFEQRAFGKNEGV